ncbi:7SK snRNA methylphosphate capping enzyme [Quillaja saponaria]|uniref:RNA methyltransferase n=1 Tax=Quillaja saponaria TaxID=32244 RepID=A0AAD7Q371_QUISA|nr:7SK snRNA methylphosphate capping enzyme [Quillaja saponaria]
MTQKAKEEVKAEKQVTQKSKKRKEVFPYGNYRNYYGYRIGRELEEDPRLKVLRNEWFEGKDCLDIGCNSGIITINIAKRFCCRNILGIDIDSNRIEEAYWNLRRIVKLESAGKAPARASKLKVAEHVNDSENGVTRSSNTRSGEPLRDFSSSQETDLFGIVSFRQENFVQNQRQHEGHYDTIICLSVTKWIHLNWDDDGLLTLFTKSWKLLRPGGILVLEPQPWKSYESNRLVSEITQANYHKILFRPERFQEILLDKIGFRLVEDITSGLLGSKTGFNRPILAFQK